MASREEYARWIVDNADKQGTPEFETVAEAYRRSSSAVSEKPEATGLPDESGLWPWQRAQQAKPGPAAFQTGIRKGASFLLGLPVDTAENVYNLAAAAIGTPAGMAGRSDLMPKTMSGTALGSDWWRKQFEGIGLPTENPAPDDATARMLHTGGTIVGGSPFPGATVKNTVAAATGGALTGEVFGPEWIGVGAMAPAGAAAAASQAKQAIANKTGPRVQLFRDVGVEPTVALATDNAFMNGIENLIGKFPGGLGVMKNFRERFQGKLGLETATGVTAEYAGRTIERGIKNPGGFIDRTHNTWIKLDSHVASKIPKGTLVEAKNTAGALDELTSPVQGAEASTASLSNPRLVALKRDLEADMAANGGQVSYEGLRRIRTKIGGMMSDPIVRDVAEGELSRLYKALSDDMREAAKANGVLGTFERANKYYAARMDRIQGVLNRVLGKDKMPEDIFKAIEPKDPDASGKLTATLRSLKPDERRIVASAVINRLGRAKPNKQNEYGDEFDSETFLTNWNKISPRAKSQLFANSIYVDNINKIAAISNAVRKGSVVFQNSSGTAAQFAAYSVYTAPLVALGTGNPGVLVGAGASVGAANLGAKLFTNQRFVNWLANAPPDPKAVPVHFARLAEIYNSSDDEEFKQELTEYVNRAGQYVNGVQ